jgi:hypothetical protein
MPIIVRKANADKLDEFMMIELQGDLETRYDDMKDCSGAFVGDVIFNKFGNPVS